MRVVLALRYGGYEYDAVIVVNFIVDFVRVGVNDRWCVHSCDVDWLEVGVLGCRVLGAALGFDFVF